MAELSRDVGSYLISLGLAKGMGVDVFLNTRPDQPDNLISIFDTGGYPAELSIPNLRRTIQVMVRDMSYSAGRERIWALFKALDKPGNRVITMNGRKTHTRAMQPPVPIDRDASNRVLFVFNVEVVTSRD